MEHFVSERLSMAVASSATAQHAIDITIKYINEREAFGQKIGKFQVLRHRIAQMASEIQLNKQFVYSLYKRFEISFLLHKQKEFLSYFVSLLSIRILGRIRPSIPDLISISIASVALQAIGEPWRLNEVFSNAPIVVISLNTKAYPYNLDESCTGLINLLSLINTSGLLLGINLTS